MSRHSARGTPSERPSRHTISPTGLRGRLWRTWHWLREPQIALTIGFALVIVLSAGLISGAWLSAKLNGDWYSVASVNGASISREGLQGQMTFETFLYSQQTAAVTRAQAAGHLDANTAASLQTALSAGLGDPVSTARNDLVDDALVRQLAAREGVKVDSPDPWATLATYIEGGFRDHLLWISIAPASPSSSATPTPGPSVSPSPTPSAMSTITNSPGTSSPPSPSFSSLPSPSTFPSPAPSPSPSTNPSLAGSDWPTTDLTAATAQARQALNDGVKVADIITALKAAGWTADGADTWISTNGSVSTIDAQLVAAARSASGPSDLGPFTDRHGAALIGRMSEQSISDQGLPARLQAAASTANVPDGTVRDWAQAQALRLALESTLVTRWNTTSIAQVQGSELVVGPSAVSGSAGPWVELSALDVASIPASAYVGATALGSPAPAITGTPIPSFSATPASSTSSSATTSPSASVGPIASPDSAGVALAAWLRARPGATRQADLLTLVKAATPNTGASNGELGFFVKADLDPAVGSVVFASGVKRGDVTAPINVGGKWLVFLVEAVFGGTLDQRSEGALLEGRTPGADWTSLASTFSPSDAGLVKDSTWWTKAEFGDGGPTASALFDTPAGEISNPLVLEGGLALFRPSATKTALPDAPARARLAVNGFAAWFTAERTKAAISLAANPLPSASASASAAYSMPSIPALATPYYPSIPGTSGQPTNAPAPGNAWPTIPTVPLPSFGLTP